MVAHFFGQLWLSKPAKRSPQKGQSQSRPT